MTHDLKFSLEELADADAPPSSIDIDKARHDGRRKLATARLAPVGAGLAVVAACGIAVSGIAGGGSSPTSAAGGSPSTSTQGAMGQGPAKKVAALTGIDPLHAHAAFGKLPAGWKLGTVEDGADYSNHTAAFKGDDPTTGPYASIQITDKKRSAETFHPAATVRPANVPGLRDGEYITVPADGIGFKEMAYNLQWQTAQGTWATLSVFRAGSAEAAQELMNSLATGAVISDTEVPLPLHIDGLPKGLAVGTQERNVPGWEGKSFAIQMDFGSGDRQLYITAEPSGPAPSPHTATSSGIPTPPANTNPIKYDRACKDDNGLTICVNAREGVLDSVGGAKGLLKHVTSLGTERANWTTHVLS
jgi:hypothetical protein